MTEEIKDQETTEASSENAAAPSPKKKGLKRWQIVVIVIVAVILVGGIGFGVWHEQPSFCNAICHTPMDNFVEGYYNDDSTLAYKHGHANGSNTTAASTLKAGVKDSSMTCLSCHTPKMDEQLTEGIAWLGGNYTVDQSGSPVISNPSYSADKEFCTTCHDYEKVIAATEHYWGEDEPANPHASHQGEQDCSTCHSVHGTSTLMCSSCHNFTIPEGWQSVGQAQDAASK
jgi:nitrate reductase NapE component